MNLQGILPTWQWWIDTEGTKLSVDFDYGPTYKKFDVNGNEMEIGYTQVGAYKGGSSLVISGTLDAENLIHLFKTDLSVSAGSKAKITYNKPSASDGTQMKLALTFKNSDAVEYIALPESGTKTNGWKTATVDLSKYAGKEIAAIALAIDPRQANSVEGYQVNIGAVTVTDGASHTPAAPQNLAIEKAYGTNEMILTWDKADYETVKEYNVYATYADGTKKMLGGIYGSKFYVKNTGDDITGIEVVAVGADGSESAAARVDYSYGTKVQNLTVEEAMTSTGYFSQSATAGQVKASWTAPSGDFDSYVLELTLDYSDNKTVYTATADKNATEAVVKVPVNEGAKYTLAVSTVKDGVKNAPVCYGGYLKDTYCAPYDGVVRISGNTLFLDSPSAADWWQISVSCNGTQLSIPNKYSASNTSGWKGVARLNAISLPDEYGVIEVVMTDYSGNVSETKAIPFAKNPDAEITESVIPDEALRTKLTEIIGGNTIGELLAYEGELDLSDIGAKDLTGLNLVVGATSIDLSGNAELEKIENVFGGMANLSELNISGLSGLVVFDIHNSQVEKIVCDDPSALENIVYVNVSGCRLDLSEGTPEADFVAAMEEMIADKDDVITTDPDESNFAPKGSVVSGSAEMFNGSETNYVYVNSAGAEFIVDFGTEKTVEKWELVNYSGSYRIKGFTLYYSNDGENYVELLEQEDVAEKNVTGSLDTPITARYFKMVSASSGYVREFKLIGHELLTTSAVVISDAQRPAVYYAETEDEAVTVRADGTPADVMQWAPKAVTVRGTAFADLADADFIAESVDVEGIANSVEAVIAADEDVLEGTVIDTAVKGVYTVSYAADGEQLKTVTVTVAVDPSALEGLVETAEAIDTGKYTEESLADAKAVLADEDATQSEVDAAYEALSTAINGLKEATDQPDTGDYAAFVPVLILLVLAAAGTVIFVKRRKSLAK
ncbi:MAG: discoidin domain-containing protein [Oscillospiraceae bacterium]|nr:discoidin domain-containing protein [Oscillospiraceae bacterium]MDY3066108.1 discoidin domain-containing protein [Oscillospiraceae bacterium]